MLALERKNAILASLSMKGKVLVGDLSREFGVTEETIRRDLEKLVNDGFATKTYGGAVKNNNFNLDLPFYVRKQTNIESKQYIASLIGSMINDGDCIMLDSSTTALCVIRSILRKSRITLITNSIEILLELSNKTDWTIISTGGMLKEDSLSLVGSQTEHAVSNYHADMAICSCMGIDNDIGITESNEHESQVKKAFFKSAGKKILALDSTKFDKAYFVRAFNFSDIDILVTDKKPPDIWLERLQENNIKVVYEEHALKEYENHLG